MQNLDPLVFLAVLQEMMGPLLWLVAGAAAAGLAALAAVLLHERHLASRRLVRSEAVGVLGGFAALWLMATVTHSGFTDAGGPVDWLLIGVIWGAGLVGGTVLAYAVQGLAAWRSSHR
ncbi:DUF5368 domain-containing protein [Azospirillum sp. ST 5-10]|uniref:DUF5368 domain-containing protein n=1 Tax=unclassified Azospirillum TaxID=2630922 RepID=UPI003F4A2F94